jgi:hypothetical protein
MRKLVRYIESAAMCVMTVLTAGLHPFLLSVHCVREIERKFSVYSETWQAKFQQTQCWLCMVGSRQAPVPRLHPISFSEGFSVPFFSAFTHFSAVSSICISQRRS